MCCERSRTGVPSRNAQIHCKTEQKEEEKKGKEISYSEVRASELCRHIDYKSEYTLFLF